MFITVENAWVLQVSVLLGLAVGIIASWIGELYFYVILLPPYL